MKNFNNILGQSLAIKLLNNMLKKEKVHNSLIFLGPESVGKFNTAFLFSKTFFCFDKKKDNGLSCDQCKNCQRHNHFSFLNSVFLSASDRMPQINFWQKLLLKTKGKNVNFFKFLKWEIYNLMSRHHYKFLKLLKGKKQSFPAGVIISENKLNDLKYQLNNKLNKSVIDNYFLSYKLLEDLNVIQNCLDRTFFPQDSYNQLFRWCQVKNNFKKIVIIENLELMSELVMSKFLKLLEDPPENVYFILIAEKLSETSKIIKPLVSRSMVINFNYLRGVIPEIIKTNFNYSNFENNNQVVSCDSFKDLINVFDDDLNYSQLFKMIIAKDISIAKKTYIFTENKKISIFDLIAIIQFGVLNYFNDHKVYQRFNFKLSLNKLCDLNDLLKSTSRLAHSHQVLEANLFIRLILFFHNI